MKSGYETAINMAKQKLGDGPHRVNWFGEDIDVESGEGMEQVLWLHYLTSEGTRPPTGKLISFREIPGAAGYESIFTARAIRPVIKTFGSKVKDLYRAGAAMDAHQIKAGDASITVTPLPNLPITFVLWEGDDELPPNGTILFDETAPYWLPAEDLVVLASLCSYKLIKL